MVKTKFGVFDGNSWEALCQLVFKKKYGADGYQEVNASPGDYGLDGITLVTGLALQCYCPDKQKTTSELYEAQRDKITEDLGKLKTYAKEIKKRLEGTKIRFWIFVAPEMAKNDLLAHARSKEREVKGWGLDFVHGDFTILLHDGGHYASEINEINLAAGLALSFDDLPPTLPPLQESGDVYEQNVLRKSKLRLAPKIDQPTFGKLVAQLHSKTLESFLQADAYLRQIEAGAPTHYLRLVKLINEYSNSVEEMSVSWTGSPEALTEKVRSGLEERVFSELSPAIDRATAAKIARLITARWTATCQLDYV